MTLESAEKLVERILRQLEVEYQVEQSPDGEKRIVADVDSVSTLPAELRPFVTPRGGHSDSGDGT